MGMMGKSTINQWSYFVIFNSKLLSSLPEGIFKTNNETISIDWLKGKLKPENFVISMGKSSLTIGKSIFPTPIPFFLCENVVYKISIPYSPMITGDHLQLCLATGTPQRLDSVHGHGQYEKRSSVSRYFESHLQPEQKPCH